MKIKRNKWKILLCVAALVVSSIGVTGCGSDQGSESSVESSIVSSESVTTQESEAVQESESTLGTEESQEPEESVAAVSYPLTLTDQAGREVVLEAEPSTIVSGYYISTSLLLALDCEERLVGVEAKAGSRNLYQLSAPGLVDLPNVGTAKEFDLEQCAALQPELAVLPIRLQSMEDALTELNIPVLFVNPEDQELLEEAITLLGQAVNQTGRAAQLLDYSTEYLTNLQTLLAAEETPSVYLASNSSLLSVAGSAMYQDTLITNAGGTNVAAEIGDDYWSEVSYEQLLAWNPDYIILAADADYTVEDVLADEQLGSCNAVVNGQIYQFPSDIEAWDSPVPSSILGTLWLASVLHAEQYPVNEYQAVVTDYYETFYRFTPQF